MRLFEWLTLAALRGYGRFLSPLLPPSCRFYPSCSVYAIQAIQHYGLGRGGWMALRRLSHCHPFHEGGYDPPLDKRTHG